MAELIQLKCPNCAGELEWAGGVGAECPHCGSRFLVPTESAERLACPMCGKVDRVQKISAACRAPGADSRLSPPREPTRSDEMEAVQVVLGVILIALFYPIALVVLWQSVFEIVVYRETSGFLILLSGLFFVGFGSLGWISIVQGKRKRERAQRRYGAEKDKHERVMHGWERLYYCARDDGVFIPGETPFIPTDKMQPFLYTE